MLTQPPAACIPVYKMEKAPSDLALLSRSASWPETKATTYKEMLLSITPLPRGYSIGEDPRLKLTE